MRRRVDFLAILLILVLVAGGIAVISERRHQQYIRIQAEDTRNAVRSALDVKDGSVYVKQIQSFIYGDYNNKRIDDKRRAWK